MLTFLNKKSPPLAEWTKNLISATNHSMEMLFLLINFLEKKKDFQGPILVILSPINYENLD